MATVHRTPPRHPMNVAVIQQYCDSYQLLFDLGVAFIVAWSDSDGDTVLELEIEPSDR